MDLTPLEFKEIPPRRRKNTMVLLQEQIVKSLGHRYIGRFDASVVSWDDAPIVHMVLERKYPANCLPQDLRPEDLFQTGLYALALMESGFSCSSTQLVVVYCLQERALKCKRSSDSSKCVKCKDARVFSRSFRPEKLLRELKRLDEIWYSGRVPKPQPSVLNCRVCPFGSSICDYSES